MTSGGLKYASSMADAKRVCSLLPSGTEIMSALGEAGRLVGVSEECDWPPEVRDLPVVTGSRVDISALDDAAIDAAVKQQVVDGESLYAIDDALLAELAPDLIITQELCRVCAVSSEDLSQLELADADVLALDPRTLDEIEDSVRKVATRLGVPDRGNAVAARMRERVAEAAAAVSGLVARRVFVAEWADPPFASGHWLPEMTALAGGDDVLGRPGQPAFETTWEAVAEQEPELVVIAACGHDASRAARGVPSIPFPCRVVAVDASAYFSCPGPRLAEGVAQLAHLFHPDSAADPGLPLVEVASGGAAGA